MPTVIVIGGGISGLATARGVADRLPGAEVVVLEAGPVPGGCIRTSRDAGFTCEAGPNGFLNRHPSTLALALRVGLGDELLTGCEQLRRRFILADARLRRFPDSPSTFLSTDLLSWRARLRMLLEPLVPAAPAGVEETVGQFARRRLGRGAADLLVEPVVSGIYAGDPERLSLAAALPQLRALDGGRRSLLRAYLRSRQEPPGDEGVSPSAIGRRRLVSFRGGAGRLVEALAESLGPAVRCDSPVERVARDGRRWRVVVGGARGDELLADVVVSAAPAPCAARYLSGVDRDLARTCARVPYAPVAMAALGFREADVPHPLDGFGYLVSGREGGAVLGVLWSTSIFPGHRSPPGTVLLQAILGGSRQPRTCELDDDALIDVALEQLHVALGVSAAPVHARTFRHVLGIPQYELGHLDRLRTADAALARLPGLFLTGNAFRGVGTNACTADAERVVESVGGHLGVPWPEGWAAEVPSRA